VEIKGEFSIAKGGPFGAPAMGKKQTYWGEGRKARIVHSYFNGGGGREAKVQLSLLEIRGRGRGKASNSADRFLGGKKKKERALFIQSKKGGEGRRILFRGAWRKKRFLLSTEEGGGDFTPRLKRGGGPYKCERGRYAVQKKRRRFNPFLWAQGRKKKKERHRFLGQGKKKT